MTAKDKPVSKPASDEYRSNYDKIFGGKRMKTKQEILAEIPNFYGTGAYHLWSGLFQNFVMTDGAKYIADECHAYWLMDLIASHVGSYKDEGFVVAKLRKTDADWVVSLEDGNDGQLAAQTIEYSDFPLDEITLYVVRQQAMYVVMLPGEY